MSPSTFEILAAFSILTLALAEGEPASSGAVLPGGTDPREEARREMVERMDRHNLRLKTSAVIETSAHLLRPPPGGLPPGAEVAAVPPRIELAIIPLEPRFLNRQPSPDMHVGVWSTWGQGFYDAATARYYGSVGNHVFYDARIHLVEYDTRSKIIRLLPEINALMGRLPGDFGDGKIHGHLDLWNNRQLWFCTYWCAYPEPSKEQFESGYDGGHLLSWDLDKEKLTDYGAPLKRASWPYHRVDAARGLLFAVGALGEFICYDLKEQRLRFGGFPPEGIRWSDRCMVLDDATGCVYSSNDTPRDPEAHLIRYDPRANRFTRLESRVPPDEDDGTSRQIRAHSRGRLPDGSILCITRGGQMFRFWPDQDRVESLGKCWPAPNAELYTTSVAVSPDGRFAYYVPAAHGRAHRLGTPVVQYELRTGRRKALAFLHPFLYERYGYTASGTYSVDITPDGKRLLMWFNGAFKDLSTDMEDVFGDPSIVVLDIPEEERR
ncbi:MAG: hypothetical protein ACUVS8_11400 [Armatimonadota bacterium]